jgi:hypothetical protein
VGSNFTPDPAPIQPGGHNSTIIWARKTKPVKTA